MDAAMFDDNSGEGECPNESVVARWVVARKSRRASALRGGFAGVELSQSRQTRNKKMGRKGMRDGRRCGDCRKAGSRRRDARVCVVCDGWYVGMYAKEEEEREGQRDRRENGQKRER